MYGHVYVRRLAYEVWFLVSWLCVMGRKDELFCVSYLESAGAVDDAA